MKRMLLLLLQSEVEGVGSLIGLDTPGRLVSSFEVDAFQCDHNSALEMKLI